MMTESGGSGTVEYWRGGGGKRGGGGRGGGDRDFKVEWHKYIKLRTHRRKIHSML